MKRMYSLIAVVALVSIATMLLLTPSNATSQAKGTAIKGFVIPDSISKIAQHSCIACHAEGGKAMALAHLNLSKWDNYTPAKQIDKALAMCKMVTKGAMPPKGFKASHPDAVLTDKQVKTICNWANSLKI